MEKKEWLAQVRKGILEYSVLLIIQKKPIYGYDLLSQLNEQENFTIAEGTIYPLLRRLEKSELIESSWKETIPGVPPRKYYQLTKEGMSSLGMMNKEWKKTIQSVDAFKRGGV